MEAVGDSFFPNFLKKLRINLDEDFKNSPSLDEDGLFRGILLGISTEDWGRFSSSGRRGLTGTASRLRS